MTDADESDPTMIVFTDPEVRDDFSLRRLLASWRAPHETTPLPKRPLWKRRRAAAALALWLVVAYPLLCGPLRYAVVRGWLPKSSESAFVWPGLAPRRLPVVGRAFSRYHWWWVARAAEAEGWTVHEDEGGVMLSKHSRRHAASD